MGLTPLTRGSEFPKARRLTAIAGENTSKIWLHPLRSEQRFPHILSAPFTSKP